MGAKRGTSINLIELPAGGKLVFTLSYSTFHPLTKSYTSVEPATISAEIAAPDGATYVWEYAGTANDTLARVGDGVFSFEFTPTVSGRYEYRIVTNEGYGPGEAGEFEVIIRGGAGPGWNETMAK